LPGCLHGCFLFDEIGQFFAQLIELKLVFFAFDGFALNLQLLDPAGNFVEFLGNRIRLQSQAGCRFVHQVDGFVGQKTIADVARRQFYGCQHGFVLDSDLMVIFVTFLEPPEYGNGIGNVRLIHHHRLKPPFEGFVFLEKLLVFVQSGGSDSPEFPPGQSRFQDIGGIHGPFALACTHQGMNFVDKEHYLSFGFDHFAHYGFQPFFKFSLVFGPRYQSAHIERINLLGF